MWQSESRFEALFRVHLCGTGTNFRICHDYGYEAVHKMLHNRGSERRITVVAVVSAQLLSEERCSFLPVQASWLLPLLRMNLARAFLPTCMCSLPFGLTCLIFKTPQPLLMEHHDRASPLLSPCGLVAVWWTDFVHDRGGKCLYIRSI